MKHIMTLTLSMCILLVSQAKELTGRVTTFGNIPLAHVEVTARSGAKTLTDTNGLYRLETKNRDMVTFRAEGFVERKIRIKDDQPIDVNLMLQDGDMAQQLATSNNHISKENLEKGLATVGYTNYKYYEMTDIYEVLRMEHPGIRVDSQSNGEVYLVNQGNHSLSLSKAALLVVDGLVTNDISNIEPTQIKSIAVLQGADASLYGVRGANGVIEITLISRRD
ncbi:MAG: TonB-dependent receptor plug domain-containing protein [Cyclobacteriaceae bacterium]